MEETKLNYTTLCGSSISFHVFLGILVILMLVFTMFIMSNRQETSQKRNEATWAGSNQQAIWALRGMAILIIDCTASQSRDIMY